jgi:Holliday junction resolvase RusA-like endonuclease
MKKCYAIRLKPNRPGIEPVPDTKLILPLPPSLNHAYITRRGTGQRIMTDKTREYKREVAFLIMKQLRLKSPLKYISLIQYRFWFPDNRKRDVPDNYSKVLRDCLKGVLVEDDCWQCIGEECFGPNWIDKDNPRVEVGIKT